jgi:hypothetical protein
MGQLHACLIVWQTGTCLAQLLILDPISFQGIAARATRERKRNSSAHKRKTMMDGMFMLVSPLSSCKPHLDIINLLRASFIM